jgi:hypothetical protein
VVGSVFTDESSAAWKFFRGLIAQPSAELYFARNWAKRVQPVVPQNEKRTGTDE